MKIIIEISHPAHVHLFHYVTVELKKLGHDVRIVARDKDVTIQLLNDYGIAYENLSRQATGVVGLMIEMLQRDIKLWRIAKKYQPDVFVSLSMCSAHVAWLMKRVSIILDDSEHAKLERAAWLPFTNIICTPESYKLDLGFKHIRYPGFHELAYLHPNRFQPDPSTLREVGLVEGEKFFILRFVSWAATHDIGQSGFSYLGKQTLVSELAKLGRVIITSESPLTPDYEPYRLSVSPTKIHSILSYSTLYVGEGATMASEAAMLGVPAIYVNSITAGTLEEQEHKYGLLQHITDEDKAISTAVELAQQNDIRLEYQLRRKHLLQDKIDVTAWLVKLIEDYR